MRYCLICMCLFEPYLTSAQSKEIVSDSRLDELIEVELKIFQGSSEQILADLLLKKSTMYRELSNYQAALSTLQRISSHSLHDTIQSKIMNEQIFLLYLNGDYEQAKNAILEARLLDYSSNDDVRLVEILNYVALKDLTQAKQLYKQMNPHGDLSRVFDSRKFRKPEKAFNLSLILPGSGQIYAGSVFRGVTSLSVQTFLFTYGIKGIGRRYFFTEALPSVALFQGFYFGGAEFAKELVHKRNKEIVEDLSNQVLSSF